MPPQTKDRDVKHTLSSLKNVLNSIQNANEPQQDVQKKTEKKGTLEMMLRQMRVSKLSQVFVQKLSRANLFQTPTYHHIQSQKQINENRILKLKGLSIDNHFISIIYILDIFFCLTTLVTGSFRAFINVFKRSGDGDSHIFIALMIAAIIVTSVKILVKCAMIRIQDGILLEYLTDIWMSFFQNQAIFIDMAYVAINVSLLVLNNDSSPLSVALFVISIVKLFSLYENLRTFQVTFVNSPKKQQYFNLVKVALFNIFFAHFVASILLAMSLIDEAQNWKVVKGIDQQEWYIQYIWAFYWACTIIMTVGFGDFSAFFFRQAIIIAFIQLFSCIVLAYNISEIGSIIMSIRASQTEFRRKIAIFKRMAKENQIDEELQRRIEGYLREQTEIKETFQFNQQNELLSEIPENLRNQYIIEANRILFPDLPFFKNLQKNTLIGFTQKFTGKVYYPGQYLMRLQQGNSSIMILKTGKVGLAYKKYGSYLNGTVVQQVKVVQKQVLTNQGSYVKKDVPILMSTDFLSQTKKINYDIIAQNYSFVYDITYENFFAVIKESEIDSSYFFSIKHKHTVVQNEWQQLVCQYCSKPQTQNDKDKDNDKEDDHHQHYHLFKQHKKLAKMSKTKCHTKFDCPRLHYFPLNGMAILKNIRYHSIQQTRDKEYFRKRHRYCTSLVIRKSFYKVYQETRNFVPKKKLQAEKQKKRKFSLDLLDREKNNEPNIDAIRRQQQKLQHVQTIQRIVRQSIEQALTGYKPQFWDLQIDKLYNYVNYFPLQNSKNLDFIQISKGKRHINAPGSDIIPGKGGNNQKTLLNIMKEIQYVQGKKYGVKQTKYENSKKE